MLGFEDAPRYAESVRRMFGTDELVPPGIVLEADRPEYGYVKRERWIHAYESVSAVAGQYGYVSLVNPANSGVLLVIYQIYARPTTSGNINVRMVGTTYGTNTANCACVTDLRFNNPIGTCYMGQGNSAVQLGTYLIGSPYCNASLDTPILMSPIILPPVGRPRSTLYLNHGTLNDGIRFSAVWAERPWRPEELADV